MTNKVIVGRSQAFKTLEKGMVTHDAFAGGWLVESVRRSRFEVIHGLKDLTFSEGGPKAWFAVVRRGG